ncbi:MAG: phosphopantothenoylcysteine decarboxylase [Anaerovoracaceae bacterium]
MKRVLITGGPTNEPIDEVMKITNMSTGSLSLSLSELFIKGGYSVDLVLNKGVNADTLKGYEEGYPLRIFRVETTDDMLEEIHRLSKEGDKYSLIIHAAAVGDYKADFTFLMEDLASLLFKNIEKNNLKTEEEVLALLKKGEYRISNESKISSYQDNLSVKLALTKKIIKELRDWFPDSLIIGCKLLDKVDKEELFETAKGLAIKNRVDYILANDLDDLKKGDSARYLVNEKGYTDISFETPSHIYRYIDMMLNK